MKRELSEYGVFIKKYRLDRGIRLKDMAERLDYPSSYLSAMEHGKKISSRFVEVLTRCYSFTDEEKELILAFAIKQTKEATQKQIEKMTNAIKNLEKTVKQLSKALVGIAKLYYEHTTEIFPKGSHIEVDGEQFLLRDRNLWMANLIAMEIEQEDNEGDEK